MLVTLLLFTHVIAEKTLPSFHVDAHLSLTVQDMSYPLMFLDVNIILIELNFLPFETHLSVSV